MVFKQPLVSNLKPHCFHLDISLKFLVVTPPSFYQYTSRPDPSNTQISTPRWGGALQLTGGNIDNQNSDQLLYHPRLFWNDLSTSCIGKFRFINCWYICTAAFDLHRDASNTEILSLYRYGIKCICSNSFCILFGAFTTLT